MPFWVQGVTTGGETQAYRASVQAFTAAGWSTTPDENGPSKITRAHTRDGYAIIAQLNSVGGLSLTGSSPCFPAVNDTTTTPQPTTIPHPAGLTAPDPQAPRPDAEPPQQINRRGPGP